MDKLKIVTLTLLTLSAQACTTINYNRFQSGSCKLYEAHEDGSKLYDCQDLESCQAAWVTRDSEGNITEAIPRRNPCIEPWSGKAGR